MAKRVSVIVPSYNHASYIKPCLESILAQDYNDTEIIVVDDCSSDDSVKIAQSIDDPRIQVRKNSKNLGTYATQNRAMDLASGDYVAVLNSDDLWKPAKLRKQIELLEKNPDAKFCYTLGDQIDEQGNPLKVDQHLNWPKTWRHDLLPFLLSSNRLLASSVVFRKGDVRFEESLRYSGDWWAWVHLAQEGDALCVPEPLVSWRQHPSNSYTRSAPVTLEEIRVRRAILAGKKRWLTARPKDLPAIKKGLSDCAIDLSALYVLVGQMRLAMAAASLAMTLFPSNSVAQRRFALSIMPGSMARKRLWRSERVAISREDLQSLAPLEV